MSRIGENIPGIPLGNVLDHASNGRRSTMKVVRHTAGLSRVCGMAAGVHSHRSEQQTTYIYGPALLEWKASQYFPRFHFIFDTRSNTFAWRLSTPSLTRLKRSTARCSTPLHYWPSWSPAALSLRLQVEEAMGAVDGAPARRIRTLPLAAPSTRPRPRQMSTRSRLRSLYVHTQNPHFCSMC